MSDHERLRRLQSKCAELQHMLNDARQQAAAQQARADRAELALQCLRNAFDEQISRSSVLRLLTPVREGRARA